MIISRSIVDIGTPMAGAYQNQPAISAFSKAAGPTLLVLFMGVTGGQADKSVYSTRRVNGGAFSVPEVRYHGSAEYPDLATSATGTVAATWHGWTQEFNYEPYFSVSRDGGSTWTAPEPRGPRDPSLGTRPAVARNSTGVIALFWDDDYRAPPINKSDILARVSLDDGASWSDIFEIFRGVDFSREVEVAAGSQLFRAVWHDGASGTFQIGLATAQ